MPPGAVWEKLRQAALEHDRAIRAMAGPYRPPVLSTDGGPSAFRLSLGFAALTGRLEPTEGGCRLNGRIGLHPNFQKARPIALGLFVFFFWRPLLPSYYLSSGSEALASLIYPVAFIAMLYFAFVQIPRKALKSAPELIRLVDAYAPSTTPASDETLELP
jgi:hypothetical protein